MPYYQSDLDGLCGVFSVINAIDHFYGLQKDEAQDLYRYILENSDAIEVAVNGSVTPELKQFMKLAVDWVTLNELPEIEWKQPFMKKKFDSPQAWLDYLKTFVTDSSGVIIGVEEPSMHWTVVQHVGPRYLRLSDSGGWDRYRITAIYLKKDDVPEDAEKHECLVVAPHQVFVIRLKGP